MVGLVISSILLSLSSKHVQLRRLAARTGYDAIPLQERDGASEKLPGRSKQPPPTPLRKSLLLLLVPAATLALCSRIDLARRIQLNSACSTGNLAVSIPLLVAVYDALRFQIQYEVEIDRSANETWRQATSSAYLCSRWRFVPLAALLSFGCYALTGLWATSQSTYICPVASNGSSHVAWLQLFSVIIDAALAIAAYELSLGNHVNEWPFLRPPTSWCLVTAGCALVWIFISTITYISQPEHRVWFMLSEISVFALVGKAFALAILCCLVLLLVSILPHTIRFTLTLCRYPHLACYMYRCF